MLEQQYFSVSQIAALFGVSRRAFREGMLPHFRADGIPFKVHRFPGQVRKFRFHRDDVQQALDLVRARGES